jgi:colicin import membrane protein
VTHRASTGGRLFWLGFALSAAVHLTFGFYLFTRYEHTPGAVDVRTDAISVNLETTDILNAREESQAVEAAGANPPPEAGEITPPNKTEEPRQPPPQDGPAKAENPPEEPAKTDPAEAERKEAEKRAAEKLEAEKQEAERVEQERLAEEALRRTMDAEREKAEAEQREREARQRAEEERQRQREAEQREAERREEERERQAEAREKAEKQRREQRKAAKANGGATGSQGTRASSGRVSASQGDIRNYGAIVRARIARNSPAARGAKGNARIAIALSTSGGLISARIVTSSGNVELDRSALAAVHRSSPFPPPPKGATRDQLSFTIPFQFH